MRHPFDLTLADLEAIDLEFEEPLTPEEAAQVGGGLIYTTLALGEEGGSYPPHPAPFPKPPRRHPLPPRPIHPPEVTTMAIGEEGGEMTTMAIGEEGGASLNF